MKHILVVDDDAAMRDLFLDYFSKHALNISVVANGQEMNRVLMRETVDLLIVDLDLDREDGLELVRTVAGKSDVPIIIISGDRVDEIDKVMGLEFGAVDYVTKPFGRRELLARMRVPLRDKGTSCGRDLKFFDFVGWSLDLKLRRLMSPVFEELKLTVAEFNLLTAFLSSPKQVLTREQLLSASRVHGDEVFDRSIDVLILRLRRKLEEDATQPQLIKTERGTGYFFDADVETRTMMRSE